MTQLRRCISAVGQLPSVSVSGVSSAALLFAFPFPWRNNSRSTAFAISAKKGRLGSG